MQKRHVLTTCAVAVLAAAANAQAAEVQIYGLIDTGLSFTSVDADNGAGRNDSLSMGQSQLAPNRWGFRGTEDLGNGFKVGFNLEGQFASDTGTMTGNRIFHRTAQVSLISEQYGTLNLGRSGALRSGFGTTGIWNPKTNPFSNSAGSFIAGHKYIMPGGFKAIDNAITYQSPVWAGAQLHLQYSSDNDSVSNTDGVENKDSANRQWGVGLTYANGPLHVVAILDSVLYETNGTNPERAMAFSAEADYNFDVAKIYVAGMWFDDMKSSEFQGHVFNSKNWLTTLNAKGGWEGYTLELGADVPMAGGTFKANLGWMDAEGSEDSSIKTDRMSVGVGYVYPLSKRSQLYTAAGYIRDSYESTTQKEVNPDAYEVIVGVLHRF